MSENTNENVNNNNTNDYQKNIDNSANGFDYTVSISETSKKKTPLSTKIIAGVCGFVVGAGAIIGISYAASDSFKNTLRLNFTSSKSYYEWVERKNAAMLAENLADIASTAKKTTNVSLSVSPNAGLNQTLLLLGITDFQNASLTYSLPKDNYTDLTLNINDSDILTLALYEDSKDNSYISVPQLSESFLKISKDSKSEDETSENENVEENVLKTIGNYFDYADSAITAGKEIKKYTKLVSSDIENVDVEKSQEITINSCTYKFSNINISLTGDELKNILSDLKEEISSDSDLKDLCSSYLSVSDSDFDDLSETIDDMYDSVDSSDSYEMTVYVNSKGVICGRTLTSKIADTNNETTLSYFYINQDNKVNISFVSDDENILSGIASKSGNTYSGTFTYGDENDSPVSITFDNLKTTTNKKVTYIDGTATVTSGDDTFDIVFASEDKTQSVSFDVVVDSLNYASVKLSTTINGSENKETYIPDNDSIVYDSSVDTELDEFINEVDSSKINAKISDALGASSLLSGLSSDDDYYYDYSDDYSFFYKSDLETLDIIYDGVTVTQNASNPEIGKLFGVDTSQIISAYESSDMYYDETENNYICYWNSDSTEKALSDCILYTIFADVDSDIDFSINQVTFGSSYDDIVKAFNLEQKDDSSSLVQIYDDDGLYEVTFYLYDGVVSSIEYYDYN